MYSNSPSPKHISKASGHLQKLVRKVKSHVRGKGCECGAVYDYECGCDADWTSKREAAAVVALTYCLQTLKQYHTTKPGITETIRNTELILDAGNYRPNAER